MTDWNFEFCGESKELISTAATVAAKGIGLTIFSWWFDIFAARIYPKLSLKVHFKILVDLLGHQDLYLPQAIGAAVIRSSSGRAL